MHIYTLTLAERETHKLHNRFFSLASVPLSTLKHPKKQHNEPQYIIHAQQSWQSTFNTCLNKDRPIIVSYRFFYLAPTPLSTLKHTKKSIDISLIKRLGFLLRTFFRARDELRRIVTGVFFPVHKPISLARLPSQAQETTSYRYFDSLYESLLKRLIA